MDITKDLDLSTTRDQCTLRSRYESTVARCVAEGTVNEIFDTLHGIGVALNGHEDAPGRRGLLLDIWDVWKNATGQSHPVHPTLAEHRFITDRLIQSFVANKFPDTGLANLLPIDTSGDDSLWRRALAGFLVHCSDESPQASLDAIFIACARLLFSVYETERSRARELLEAQLRDLEAWIGCRGTRVYGPEDIDGEQAAVSDEVTRTEEFSLTLGHLAVLLKDCFEQSEVAAPSLHDLATALFVERPHPADTLLLQRLLKHWAAVVPFVDRLLGKFSQFGFYDESSGYGVPRGPAPYGPESFVFLSGPKEIDQTSFLFATRDATDKLEGDVSGSELQRFQIESTRGREYLSNLEAELRSRDHAPRRRILDDGLYGQTSGTGFSRLTLLPIPEGSPAEDQGANESVPRIGEFLLSTRAPSALLLLTSTQAASDDSLYGHVLNAVEGMYRNHDDETVRSEAEHVHHLPIYFLIDTTDGLIPIGDEIDEEQRKQLLRTLTRGFGDVPQNDARAVLSTPMTKRQADVPELLRLVEDSRRFCAYPPMQDRVLKDLQRLEPALDEAFGKNFKKISIAYTDCLRDESRSSIEAQQPGLLILWNDVQRNVDFARRSTLRDYLQTRLQVLTRKSMQALDTLEQSCNLQALQLPDTDRLRDDSESLRQLLRNSTVEVSSVLENDRANWSDSNAVLAWGKHNSSDSEETFVRLENALRTLDEQLTGTAANVFRELGVPYNKRFDTLESDWAQGENTFREARRNLLQFARDALPATESDGAAPTTADTTELLKVAEANVRQAREALRSGFEQHCTKFEEFLNFVASAPELASYHEAVRTKQNVESGENLLPTHPLRYHPILGAVDTVCTFRNSSDAYDAAATCFRKLENYTIMDVFNTLRPNDEELQIPHGTPAPSFAVMRCVLYALADYEPSHTQLEISFWDTDQARIDALNAHKEWFFRDRRRRLVDILETIWCLRALTTNSVAALKTRKIAYYLRMLLEASSKHGIRTQGYFEDPDLFLMRLKKLRSDLDAYQPMRGITLREKTRSQRAEKRKAISEQIMLLLDPATFSSSAFLDDKKETDSLLRDLGHIEEIVRAVNAFVSENQIEDFRDVEKWRCDDLALFAAPARSIGTLEVQLNDYASESRARILQERATYISLSGWLNDTHDTGLLDLAQGDHTVTDGGRLREIYEEAVDAVLQQFERGTERDSQSGS